MGIDADERVRQGGGEESNQESSPTRASATPQSERAGQDVQLDVLPVQRRAGNQATIALLGAPANAVVGASDDPAEREADGVARRVVETVIRSGGGRAGEGGATVDDSATTPLARRIQRQSMVGSRGGEVDKETESLLGDARRAGRGLDPATRRTMEGAFGADLGHVRVHDGSDAVVLNERLGARAFTSGRDIFFSGAVPDTTTRDGVELLAHELTHTVQQGATPVSRAIRRQEEESSVASSEEAPVVGGISASAFAVARRDVGGRSTRPARIQRLLSGALKKRFENPATKDQLVNEVFEFVKSK